MSDELALHPVCGSIGCGIDELGQMRLKFSVVKTA